MSLKAPLFRITAEKDGAGLELSGLKHPRDRALEFSTEILVSWTAPVKGARPTGLRRNDSRNEVFQRMAPDYEYETTFEVRPEVRVEGEGRVQEADSRTLVARATNGWKALPTRKVTVVLTRDPVAETWSGRIPLAAKLTIEGRALAAYRLRVVGVVTDKP